MNGNREFKMQEKRITEIFISDFPEHPKTMETIKFYKDYLQKNLIFPCELTGIEDFNWEEYYLLGPGSKKEYN